MNFNRIFTILTMFLVMFIVALGIKPISNYIENYQLNYEKEVYVGGENILLDYVTKSEKETVSSSKKYATVGTITYIDFDNKYGAIGHSLDTSSVENGNIYIVPVISVIKSSRNRIGEKDVILNFSKKQGTIFDIRETGVYGDFTGSLADKKILKVGMPRTIETSDALIYTNIDGSEVKTYKIKIEKVFLTRKTHNIYIKIVDEELINKTGGIIQGMSGSPIVQDGKIIGALSHVDDKNPIYGYGLFITNMI